MRSLDDETEHDAADLTAPEMFVLTILSWRLWKGVCNPSVHTLSRRTGHRLETVRKALRGLQAKGRITALEKSKRGVTAWRINTPESAGIAAQETRTENRPSQENQLGRKNVTTRTENRPHLGRKTVPNRKDTSDKATSEQKSSPENGNPEHRTSLTLSEYLDTARLAGASRKKSGQATRNGAGPLTIALGESRREPATGVAGIGENATQSRIQRL